MKLPILPDVLFDEFPSDESVKLCIFTQPKLPLVDYTKYVGKVEFYCTSATEYLMSNFLKTPQELYRVMEINALMRINKVQTPFNLCCIPTGNPSESVMLLIFIQENIHLYTGQFTECRNILLSPIIQKIKNRINDIHVDNTMARWGIANPLVFAKNQITQIVRSSAHSGFTMYLDMELFGYEDLLFELARNGIKVELHEVQKRLVENLKESDLFRYDGDADLKVFARDFGKRVYTERDYRKRYEQQKTLHIKLIPNQHNMYPYERVPGLFIVRYAPHATKTTLNELFTTIEPKRVHPIVPQGYNYDPISVIPRDILNDGCEIVAAIGIESKVANENAEHEVRQAESVCFFLDVEPLGSGERSNIDIEFDMESESVDADPEEVNEQPDQQENVEPIPNDELQQKNDQTDEVIVLEDDNENLLGLDSLQSSQESGSKNEPKMEQADEVTSAEAAEKSDTHRSRSESSNLNDNNNNNDEPMTAHDAPTNLNQSNIVPESIAKSAIGANKSRKRKAPSSWIQPMQRIEYFSDSGGDSDDGVNRDDDHAAQENGPDIGHEDVDNNQIGHVNGDKEDLIDYDNDFDSNSDSDSYSQPMYPD